MNIRQRLKLLRIVRILSNLKYVKSLQRNKSLYKELGLKRKVWQTLSHALLSGGKSAAPWLDDDYTGEAVRHHPRFKQFSPDLQQKILQWNRDGYMVLPGFFSLAEIEAVNRSLDESLSPAQVKRYHTDRLMNLYKTIPEVNDLFRQAGLGNILSFLLGKEALPFQTINFYQSSSQRVHSDAVHLTTEPLGYSLGVWVALEDVREGSGEFCFYPGSHKLPYILNPDFGRNDLFMPTPDALHKKYEQKVEELLRDEAFSRQTFLAKKGDILIWHTNLLHGSLPKNDPLLTRKSLIMHYFAKGVLCYHEMLEKPAVLA